jgi:hypothetical protein
MGKVGDRAPSNRPSSGSKLPSRRDVDKLEEQIEDQRQTIRDVVGLLNDLQRRVDELEEVDRE